MMKMWPPSRTGIGIRFSSPRLRLIDAIRPSSAIQPACADSPDSCAMPTGPINCFGDASPVTRSFSVLRIRPAISMLRCTLMPIASIGVGLYESRRFADVDADHASARLPCRASRRSSARRRRGGCRNSIGLSPGFFEIVSATCDANTMRSPSMARMHVAGLEPGRFGRLARHEATRRSDTRPAARRWCRPRTARRCACSAR